MDFYKTNLKPTPSWTTVTLTFDEFIAKVAVPYTMSEALENAVTLVWEVSDVGQLGWFMIDKVCFTLTASSYDSVEEDNDGDEDNNDLIGKDPADYFETFGATGLTWALPIIILFSFWIMYG
jgi:hypothetical protein